jgi:hypothetical protein
MAKLAITMRLPIADRAQWHPVIAEIERQVNALSEGRVHAHYNAGTSAPSGPSTAYSLGDFARNSAPSELGSAGSKYVVMGWICVVAGTPGTWLECRALTGN